MFGLNPRHPKAWLDRGKLQGLAARWQARRGQARGEDFDRASQSFEKALELEPNAPEARLSFGTLLYAWALHEKDAGRAPAPQLKRGLALMEEVLSLCPEWPRALLLRSKLRMLQADLEVRADEQQVWRTRARDDLSRALSKNPHLAQGLKH
jgi:serine/threonine-protein kinase